MSPSVNVRWQTWFLISDPKKQESAFYINITLSTWKAFPFRDASLDRTHLHDQLLPPPYAKIERLHFFNELYQIVSEDHGSELIPTTFLTSGMAKGPV